MLRRLDQSRTLSKLVANLSEFLARRRGLPIVVGIALVVVSFGLQVVNVSAESKVIELAGVVTHNLGVLIALIGLLLAGPLGK